MGYSFSYGCAHPRRRIHSQKPSRAAAQCGANSVVETHTRGRCGKCARKRGGVGAARLQAEVAILRQCSQLRHPNLVQADPPPPPPATGLHRRRDGNHAQFVDSFETSTEVQLVLELLSGGTLLGLLGANCRKRTRCRLRIASGFAALHLIGVVTEI